MFREVLNELLANHRGRFFGVLLGFVVGAIILIIGFWKTVFLALCALVGYWIGGISDKKERFISFLDRILHNS
ncbi:MAG: DUF2273 domain-containing protein [Clostridiales bacterium]|nr:DUF2273 domain-containing protein [Clostridiales bacterium]